jgi:hypothetical protein
MGYDEEYEELLANAKASPESADFQELRFAYARTSHYCPYAAPRGDLGAPADVVRGMDEEAATEAVRQTLESNYLDIEAHLVAALMHRRLDETEKAEYHSHFAERLLRSILESGDGRSRQTAFKVINVAEEYAVLGFLGLELRAQALLADKGHHLDEMDVLHPGTRKATTLYFNIDVPHAWLERQMDESPEKLLQALGVPMSQEGGEVSKPRKWWQFWR